jgi:N-acetylglucosamine-6-phosphate deacetylase
LSGDDLLVQGSHPGPILLSEGRIAEIGPAAERAATAAIRRLNADGLRAVRGFVELQVNGAVGFDLTDDPTAIWRVGEALPRYGVTAFLPTIISSPPATAETARRILLEGPPPGYEGAAALGLHLEGPFLNPMYAGAHNPAHLRHPDPPLAADWSPDGGVRLVTLAPELPGALELIAELARRGVLVAAGHSAATLAEARAGVEAGVRFATHLFNAMPPFDHRAPGLAGALLLDERVTIGLIVDGHHLDPAAVALAWRVAGAGRVSLVSDAMAALGQGPGRYRVGDAEVTVDETGARLEGGKLAGSVLPLDEAVGNLVAATGCSPEDAVATVTATPARLLGMPDRARLERGARADVVLLTDELRVVATFIGSRPAFVAQELGWAQS